MVMLTCTLLAFVIYFYFELRKDLSSSWLFSSKLNCYTYIVVTCCTKVCIFIFISFVEQFQLFFVLNLNYCRIRTKKRGKNDGQTTDYNFDVLLQSINVNEIKRLCSNTTHIIEVQPTTAPLSTLSLEALVSHHRPTHRLDLFSNSRCAPTLLLFCQILFSRTARNRLRIFWNRNVIRIHYAAIMVEQIYSWQHVWLV